MTIPDCVALFVVMVVVLGPYWIYEQTVYEIKREELDKFCQLFWEHLKS